MQAYERQTSQCHFYEKVLSFLLCKPTTRDEMKFKKDFGIKLINCHSKRFHNIWNSSFLFRVSSYQGSKKFSKLMFFDCSVRGPKKSTRQERDNVSWSCSESSISDCGQLRILSWVGLWRLIDKWRGSSCFTGSDSELLIMISWCPLAHNCGGLKLRLKLHKPYKNPSAIWNSFPHLNTDSELMDYTHVHPNKAITHL